MEKLCKGYKSKWGMHIEGFKKRINANGYKQILDRKTSKWVTVDYFEEVENE